MRRAILVVGVLLVAAGIGGCAQARSLSPCVELTQDEQTTLVDAGATHAGKAASKEGWVIALSPTVYERSGNGDPTGIDFHYKAADARYGTDVALAKVNTIPAELQPLTVAARACSAEL